MREFELIKKFYKPLQPTIKEGQKDIIYEEVPPSAQLKDFVYCYWQLKTPQPLENSFVYRVVSDGCIDIYFNHKNPLESFVMGFYRKYTEFSLGKEFDYVGIRFLPSAFSQLLCVSAKELSNQSQNLQPILPNIAAYIFKNIHRSHDLATMAEKLNNLFATLTNQHRFDFDSRFYGALILILKKAGNLETENDLNTGLSPRQLRRIFNYYIGTTPKAFSKVVRFQHILRAQPTKQGLKENKLFFDVGFYDQAHFIKDFKNFYGVTPSQAFG